MIFAFSPVRFRWPSEASRWLQDGPIGPQEEPKRAPGRPEERPRALQERPKRVSRGDFRGSKMPPRWPKMRQKRAQDGLQDGDDGLIWIQDSHDGLQDGQDVSPWAPRRPNIPSKTAKMGRIRPNVVPKTIPDGPKKTPTSPRRSRRPCLLDPFALGLPWRLGA